MKLAIISLGVFAPVAAVFGLQLYPIATPRCRISTVIRHVGAEPGERQRSERQFISILTGDDHRQKLPTAFASRFPLWVIDKRDSGEKHAVEVPGASEVGWVNPRSYSELWIPEDSLSPTMRLCLGMLVKDGVPRHVMPMVDLVVLKGGRKWRNRGLNTVPTAHCWEDVERAAAGVLYMSAYFEEKVKDSKTDSMWGVLAEKVPVTEALTEIMTVLADPPEGLHVESGFHFVVAEVAGFGQLPVPGSGGRVRMFLSDMPTPSDLLELPEVVGVSELGFDVVAVASGAESEFLPEVYRGLFVDES